MKRLVKWLLLGVLSLAVLLVIAALVLPAVVDPNDHKERIEQELLKASGREVKLNGPIDLTVFPWVGIELADVQVANEPGFAGDYFLKVGRAAARVRLLPLLGGDVQVGEVTLYSPDVNLEIDAAGNSNWQSLVSASAEGQGADSSESSDAQLAVAGIEIAQGQVSYRDAQSGTRAVLSDLNLETGPINASDPLEAEIGFELKMDDSDLSSRFYSRLEGEGVLGGAAMKLAVAEFEWSGQAGDLPFSLKSEGAMAYDGGPGELTVERLVAAVGDLELSARVSGSNMNADPQLSGRVEIPETSPRRWLEQSGIDLGFTNPEALTLLSASLDLQYRNDQAELKDLNIRLDRSTISGQAKLTSVSDLRGEFEVAMDTLDLDLYATADAGASEGSEESNLAELDFGNFNGAVRLGELKVGGVVINDVSVQVKTDAEGVDLDPVTASIYGGSMNTSVRLRPRQADRRVMLAHRMTGVQAGPLFSDLLGKPVMTGQGRMSAEVSLDNPTGDNPLATANGSVSLNFDEGQILGVDIFGIAGQAMALLGGGQTESEGEEEEGTRFSSMSLAADIRDGVLQTRQLDLASPVLKLGGDLRVNLADFSIAGTVEPVLLDGVDAERLGRFKSLVGVPIPVDLGGSLDAPSVGVDPAKLLLASQKQKLDEKKDRAKRKLLKSLLGDDDDDG